MGLWQGSKLGEVLEPFMPLHGVSFVLLYPCRAGPRTWALGQVSKESPNSSGCFTDAALLTAGPARERGRGEAGAAEAREGQQRRAAGQVRSLAGVRRRRRAHLREGLRLLDTWVRAL